jgi:hypothetical protein
MGGETSEAPAADEEFEERTLTDILDPRGFGWLTRLGLFGLLGDPLGVPSLLAHLRVVGENAVRGLFADHAPAPYQRVEELVRDFVRSCVASGQGALCRAH